MTNFFYKMIRFIRNKLNVYLYKMIYGKQIIFGKKFHARNGFMVCIENNGKIQIGNGVFMNKNCSINCLENVTIGNDCLFGENVKIYDHNHKFRNFDKPIAKQGFKTAPVYIGNNCWFGSNVVILKGVHIGDHVIVGAGCIINKNIPANTIVKLKSCNYELCKIEERNS